jgi:hypothetical protein
VGLNSYGTRDDPFKANTVDKCFQKYETLKKRIDTRRKQKTNVEISTSIQNHFVRGTIQQQEVTLSTIMFEFKNKSLEYIACYSCKGKQLFDTSAEDFQKNQRKCTYCKDNKCTLKQYLEDDMLPIWIDENGTKRFDQPEELQNLTLGEKLCIQKISCLMPVVHIKNGRLGIRGSTVMFENDIRNMVNSLPRTNVNVLNVLKNFTDEKNGCGSKQQVSFKIRRKKVLRALRFLVKHHPAYATVEINEQNLDWMQGKEEADLTAQNVTIYKKRNKTNERKRDETETVSKKQTNLFNIENTAIPSVHQADNMVCTEIPQPVGMALERATHNPDKTQKDLIDEIKQKMQNEKREVPYFDFPTISEAPVDEYNTPMMFATCYPWLFPSGRGDVAHNCSGNISKTLKWTRLLLRFHDGRFMREPIFTFHLLNFVQRHINNKEALTYIKSYIGDKNMTIEDVKDQVAREDYTFVNKLQSFMGSRIRGSDSWWRCRRHEVDTWISHHLEQGHGPPTLFMTFSCAEYWWSDLQKIIYERCKGTEDEDLAEIMLTSEDEKKKKAAKFKLMEMYSAVVQEFFQHRMDNWLETIGKDIFNISHYYLRFEFAKGRGQIHAHMMAITSDYQFIQGYYDKTISQDNIQATKIYSDYSRQNLALTAELPTINNDEPKVIDALQSHYSNTSSVNNDFLNLVQDTAIHECNNYCLRFRKW